MAAHRCVATPHIRPVGWPGTVDWHFDTTSCLALPHGRQNDATTRRRWKIESRRRHEPPPRTHRRFGENQMPARSQGRPEQVTLIREIVSESRRRAPTRRPRIAGSDTSQ
jgi:hypothetical protein